MNLGEILVLHFSNQDKSQPDRQSKERKLSTFEAALSADATP